MERAKEGEELFKAWNRARLLGDPEAPRLEAEAKERLQRAIGELTDLFERPEYRQPHGAIRPEYEGFERRLLTWTSLLVDLELARDFEPEPPWLAGGSQRVRR